VGAFLQKKMNNKVIVVIGSTVGISAVLISSFMTTETLFVVFYAVLFAVGIGLDYFTPLMCGWEWMPERRGFVSGIIIGGFGFGTFIFALISTAIVNPNNVKPTLK
jgi:MFS transporter, OFA family, oxalate/formate antiporter